MPSLPSPHVAQHVQWFQLRVGSACLAGLLGRAQTEALGGSGSRSSFLSRPHFGGLPRPGPPDRPPAAHNVALSMDSCAGPVPAAGDRAVSKAAGPLRSHSLPSGRGDSPRELHEESRVVSAPENCFPGLPTAPPKQPWTWPGTCFEPGPPPAFPRRGGRLRRRGGSSAPSLLPQNSLVSLRETL